MDALSQTTGVQDEFPGYPLGVRAQQLPDPTMKSYFLTHLRSIRARDGVRLERNSE